jgi:hypothetical protein
MLDMDNENKKNEMQNEMQHEMQHRGSTTVAVATK